MNRSAGLLFFLALSACSDSAGDNADADEPGGADAAVADARVADASTRDALTGDAALGVDVETPDAIASDAASSSDAASFDAGFFCDPSPCFAGVACTELPGSPMGFRCGACPPGYAGDGIACTDLDACAVTPCSTGSTCTDLLPPDPGQICTPCVGASCPVLRAQAGPDRTIAAGAIATLVGSASGANGSFRCSWTNDRGPEVQTTCTTTVAPSVATRYTLEVTDSEGRSATDDVLLEVAGFVANAGPSVNITTAEVATLVGSWSGASCTDVSCIACEWSLADGTLIASTCTATVSPAVTTQYVLTVTDDGALVTASDSTTVFVTDVPANLCGWDVVVMTSDEYPSTPNPNYSCTPDGRARRQLVNGKPSIVLSDLVVENARVIGYIGVETGTDDDLIGIAWGYVDPAHHYLLTWKQLNQNWTARCGNAPAGIAIKKVEGATTAPSGISFNPSFGFNATDYEYSCAIAWATARTSEVLFGDRSIYLASPSDPGAFTSGWRDFITYRFEIYHLADRSKIQVYEDDTRSGSTTTLVTELVVEDASYPRGRVAFFSNSQEQVDFGDFSFASLDGYRVDAGPDQSVASGTEATLSGVAELAVPPYRCSWADDTNVIATTCTTTVAPAATTTYTLTITDDLDRALSDSVTVTIAP